mmetsp:Transcript_6532/g.9236  ORF Transcript_6532/g.9236 Transcript_6532/m.9236 type:complete len:369 (-) Transcript_6532:50-1156(-)
MSTRKRKKGAILDKSRFLEAKQISFPIRDIDQLHVASETVRCALHQQCVPCAYKICCFDVALDSGFSVPNQRPETCPRLSNKSHIPNSTLGYCDEMNVLTVGDGDFSFSLGLARLLRNGKQGKKGRLIVTSYETEQTLRRVYPEFDNTLMELQSLGGIVCFEVDATRLSQTLPASVLKDNGKAIEFHRIIWNFPCTAIDRGQDGQNQAMEDNKNLVRNFVCNARKMLHSRGEVHMCHKTKPPYNQWNLQELVEKACEDKGPAAIFQGRLVLDRALLPPYTPRKALNRKSFPCHDACFYIFSFDRKNTDGECEESGQFPRTIHSKSVEFTEEEEDQIVPVTEKLVERIRSTHLSISTVKPFRKKAKKKR